MRRFALVVAVAAALGCKGESTSGAPVQTTARHVVLAWNDLGMHCLNPSYDTLVILPPYNTVWAQVIERGSPPRIVTQGIGVEYRIVGNTFSYGKGQYGQFWDNAQALFGATPARDHGLNLVDPSISNGLAGAMAVAASGDHFEAVGIPLVPMDDAGTWNPFQVAEVTVKDASGATLATTRTTVPTSDEIDCGRCHAPGGDAFADILAKHDAREGTVLAAKRPVLCASCHGSPALNLPSKAGLRYLSLAVHAFHGANAPGARCYDCHPGARTQCSRSLPHAAPDGNCTTCHGQLTDVGAAGRVPWVNEPACAKCHDAAIPQVGTGAALYRNAAGHGGVACPACHGSPHAMHPSRVASDDFAVVQDQGKAKTLGSCGVCHDTSRGGGAAEFGEEHGGASGRSTACHVCHTSVPSDTARWPHAFQWRAR